MSRLCALALVATSVAAGSAAGPPPEDLAARLERVGLRVQAYYARARSMTSTETVRIQQLAPDLSSVGRSRQIVHELRIGWEPSPDGSAPAEASVLRQILTVNGRPPKPGEEPQCMDPKVVSPEALAMLLPHRRDEFAFSAAGTGRTEGRPSVRIDYRAVDAPPPEVIWRGDCVTVSLPGKTRGRVWVDRDTDDVLRVDESLAGMYEFPIPADRRLTGGAAYMVIERADSSTRYRGVSFQDPEETLMLPRSIDTVTIWRNAGIARVRTSQVFTNYKRFITAGRVVQEPSAR